MQDKLWVSCCEYGSCCEYISVCLHICENIFYLMRDDVLTLKRHNFKAEVGSSLNNEIRI